MSCGVRMDPKTVGGGAQYINEKDEEEIKMHHFFFVYRQQRDGTRFIPLYSGYKLKHHSKYSMLPLFPFTEVPSLFSRKLYATISF